MSMEFTLEPSLDGTYVEVTVVGEITRDSAVALTRAHLALGEKLGIHCYLLDMTRARNVQRIEEDLGYTLRDVPAIETPNVPSCAAVLIDPADYSHDFHVALARSQGIEITLFWDRDAAIRHLEEAAPNVNIETSRRNAAG